jgi:hypothetical protein
MTLKFVSKEDYIRHATPIACFSCQHSLFQLEPAYCVIAIVLEETKHEKNCAFLIPPTLLVECELLV